MDSVSIKHILKKNWLFNHLMPDELDDLMRKSTTVNYRKRETIVKKGEFISHLILLLNGFVKIEVDEGDKNFIFDIIHSVNFIGLPLVLTSDKYVFSAVSITDTQLQYIPLELVKKMIETNSKIALSAIRYGNESFVNPLFEKLKSSSLNNIRGRLAKLLLHFSLNIFNSKSFLLLIGRNEIAQMIGFSRENVIRTLSEFNVEGIIKINGKSIEILDSEKLKDLARYS
jgi:CRP-like cAMP-binding protein